MSPLPVTIEEYVEFWKSAKEQTSPSDSGRHFSHYAAASHNPEVAELHVGSLNAAATRGLPLNQWRSAVIVLLEKVMDNILVDKLRAICLLEADFNWWLKLIYAH